MTLTAVLGALIVVLMAIRFISFCLDDIAQRDVRYFSKPVWSLIVCFSVPFGSMLYLVMERDSPRH